MSNNNREREIRAWCGYCKDPIYKGDAYTKGRDGHIYHPDCYNQLNTYTDEFGTSNTDQFGDIIED